MPVNKWRRARCEKDSRLDQAVGCVTAGRYLLWDLERRGVEDYRTERLW